MPPLEASNFRFIWHAFADPVPSVLTVFLDQVVQGEVLHLSPDHLMLRRFGLPSIEFVGTSLSIGISSFGDFVNWISLRINGSSVFKLVYLTHFSKIH